MIPFIIRRLLWMVVLLLVISFLTFLIFYTLPSADPGACCAPAASPRPSSWPSIRQTLGLDKPWYVQYVKYLERLVFHFDFGYSYQNNVSVKEQIFDRLPATVALAVGGVVVLAADRHPDRHLRRPASAGRWTDKRGHGLALVAISAPVYWLGLVVAVPLLRRTSASSRSSRARAPTRRSGNIFTDPGQVIPALIMPWLRARRLVRGDLRALPARQPASR